MSQHQTETRFIELMTELFQLDEAEALDFGLYRIIRRQNREIRDFIGEVVIENGRKVFQGGRLAHGPRGSRRSCDWARPATAVSSGVFPRLRRP